MALNPDNFIFHSDFWYPTDYKGGYVELVNQSIPRLVNLTNEYEPGDYYTVFKEMTMPSDHSMYPNAKQIYNFAPGETFSGRTKGSQLSAFQGAQAPGANITARFHWRLYKQPKTFNFLSQGRMEKIAKTLTGTVSSSFGSIYTHTIDTGLQGSYYVRGMIRRSGGGWFSVNDRSTDGVANFAVAYIHVPVSGNTVLELNVLDGQSSPATWEYILQLIPVYEQSNFVFSSTEYPFSLPGTHKTTITPPATVAASTTVRRTGTPYTMPGEKVSYQTIFVANHGFADYADGSPGWLEYPAAPLSGNAYTVSARAGSFVSGRVVTPYIDYKNHTTSSRAVNQVSADAHVFAYQNNNSQ